MSEMVERIAHAIAGPQWELGEVMRNRYRADARRVLFALGEPTSDMIVEGHAAVLEISPDALASAWRLMIAQALR